MRWDNPATDFVDRWRPFGLVAAVLITGLFLGMVIGLFACSPTGILSGQQAERYYVLASKLYAQGESLDAMKVYLSPVGSQDVSSNVLRLAEEYEKSADEKSRAEARDLRQLGNDLRAGPGLFSNLGRVPLPSVVPVETQVSGTLDSLASAPPTPSAVPTPIPPTPTSTPAAPAPQPLVSGQGVARPSGGGGVVLREQATTKSNMIGSIPAGAKVDVLKLVDGEAVDPVERRWYQVKYADRTGYVYFKLIAGE